LKLFPINYGFGGGGGGNCPLFPPPISARLVSLEFVTSSAVQDVIEAIATIKNENKSNFFMIIKV
jgi:hypothetical protein